MGSRRWGIMNAAVGVLLLVVSCNASTDAPSPAEEPGETPISPSPPPEPVGEPAGPISPPPQPGDPPDQPPSEAPSELSAVGLSESVVVIVWKDNSALESGFVVERKSGGSPFAVVNEPAANATTLDDVSLQPSQSYTYRVAAKLPSGLSGYSNEATASTRFPPSEPPRPPLYLHATALSTTSVLLTWRDQSSLEAGFTLERKSGDGSFLPAATLPRNTKTFTDTGLSPGSRFVYRVSAFNSVWKSAYSAEVTVQTSLFDLRLLFQVEGTDGNDQFGSAVGGAGDVNGDGTPDFIVGARQTDLGKLEFAGSVYVYSGKDGLLLYRKDAEGAGHAFGGTVATAGDLNKDGRPDFMVSATGADETINHAGSVYVYSGTDGSLLLRKNGPAAYSGFGASLCSAGDINGDGTPDLLIGAPSRSIAGVTAVGSAYVYSGADGSLLFEKSGEGKFGYFGAAVAGLGDVNGDGRPDFAVGSSEANPGGLWAAGSVFVYSGKDGTLLFRKDGKAAAMLFGNSLSPIGDVNADNISDLIVAAPGRYDIGNVYILSGKDGAELLGVKSPAPWDDFGDAVSGVGDMDGDGRADIAIGAPAASSVAGIVQILSSADGKLLAIRRGEECCRFGSGVAAIGDVNRDGKPDFLVGEPRGGAAPGRAYVLAGP